MRRRQIRIEGSMTDVLELDFEVANEQWNTYRLLDGGTLRMKTTPRIIYRRLDSDGKPEYDSDGSPSVIVNHTTEIVASEY